MGNFFSIKKALNTSGSTEDNSLLIKHIQNELLDVYKDVFEACNKYGLKLFLQGGTLLGKARHNGFIPWDDDMDLGLSRDDYDRLEEVFIKELSNKYELVKPGYSEGKGTRFAQIYRIVDGDRIGIDIFPIDYVSDNWIVRNFNGILVNILLGISSSIEFISVCDDSRKAILKKTTRGKINYYIRKIISILFGWKSIEHWFLTIEKRVRNSVEGKFCTSSLGRWHYFGEMQKSDVFFPLKKSEFCGIAAWTLNNEKQYLEHNYGLDYMIIPDISKRESHKH